MTYHLAGDSTVADAKPGEYPMSGWGGELAAFVDGPVRNLAFGGATTESFLQSGTLGRARRGRTPRRRGRHPVRAQRPEGARAPRVARRLHERLRRMVTDARTRGAVAVLCTSAERRWFDGDHVTPTHGDYPNAVRDLAHELDAPLIDLTVFTTWLYEDLGDAASRSLLSHYAPGESEGWPEGLVDDTHFRVEGARRIAAFVGRSLRAIERKDGDKPARGSELVS